jgi:energy-coupling factor transport system permease protein
VSERTGGHVNSHGSSIAALRLPRIVHPIAWWVWAIGLATAASRTTNPLLLALVLGVIGIVVAARRTEAPWARAFKFYLLLGIAVIAIRVAFRILLGGDDNSGGHVLFTMPAIPLPGFMSGVRLGGAVSAENVLAAAYDGFRLATLLCCIGAANTLANPKRALRVLPAALHELGVAITVAVTVAPQLVESAQRVLRARKLRGDTARGRRAIRGIAMPVLHDTLERSFQLAAAMDSRGYGRAGSAPPRVRRVTTALLLAGLLGLCAGLYGLLDTSTPRFLGAPMLAAGIGCAVAGLVVGGRRVQRTRYRPDPWAFAEWATALSGMGAAVAMIVAGSRNAAVLNPSVFPPAWPTLPVLPAVAVLLALLPAVLTPPPPIPVVPLPVRAEPIAPALDHVTAPGRLGAPDRTGVNA